MNLEQVQRKKGKNKYRRQVGLTVEPALADWLEKNNISSTALFRQACIELGYNPTPPLNYKPINETKYAS